MNKEGEDAINWVGRKKKRENYRGIRCCGIII